jgi:hypothetical protein
MVINVLGIIIALVTIIFPAGIMWCYHPLADVDASSQYWSFPSQKCTAT